MLEGDEFLFDLSKDSRERANLVKRHPERAAAMRGKYEAWAKTMPAIAPDAPLLFSTMKGTPSLRWRPSA